jgi:hypothetical protein
VLALDCPSCGGRLQIPPWLRSRHLTCPRCLAGIRNPNASTEPPAPATGPTGPCPVCAEDIDARARVCPLCGERVDGEELNLEGEVRRDSGLLKAGFIGLAGLGALGIAHVLLAYRPTMDPAKWGILFAIFAGVLGAGIVLNLKRENPVARGAGRAILGTLAVAGGLFVLGFLLAIAALVYLFVVCLSGGIKW